MRIAPIAKLALPRYSSNNIVSLPYVSSYAPINFGSKEDINENKLKDKFVKIKNKIAAATTPVPQTLTDKEVKDCKMIVNAATLACAGISATEGKAEAVGLVPSLLRGVQGLMFAGMMLYLKMPLIAAFEYAATEYAKATYLGCEGSKKVIWLADAVANAATGGTAKPISDGAARGVNAGLSAAITKKMGDSFIKEVKSGTMTEILQALRASMFFSVRAVFGGFDDTHTIDDLGNIKSVSKALFNTPKEHKEFFAMLMTHVVKKDLPRTTTTFLSQMAQINLYALLHDEKIDNIEVAKQAAFSAFMMSATYEMANLIDSKIISLSSTDIVKDISENMVNFPEAYSVFEELWDKLNTQYNLGKISSEAFVRQFQNRTFLQQFSTIINEKVNKFIRVYSQKKNFELEKIREQQQKQLREQEIRRRQLMEEDELQLSSEQIALIDEVAKSREIYSNLAKVNAFGYSKIAGYDEEKGFLKAYLNSLSNLDDCNSEDLTNAILFYGPRGNGKTTFASALADEFGCRFRKVDTVTNKEKAHKRLLKQLEASKQHWEEENRNTIILIDECSAFMTPPKNENEEKTVEEISKLIENAAKDYHATLFLTTNYPMKLDKRFVDSSKIPLSVPLDPPNEENAREVFKHYTNCSDLNYDKIMLEFNRMCCETNSRYSNGQIKAMIETAKLQNNNTLNEENIIEVIRSTRPEITETDLRNYNESKKYLSEV